MLSNFPFATGFAVTCSPLLAISFMFTLFSVHYCFLFLIDILAVFPVSPRLPADVTNVAMSTSLDVTIINNY